MRGPRRPRWAKSRAMRSDVMHSICGLWERLRLEGGGELTTRQEWMWDQMIGELEWRSWNLRQAGLLGCLCRFCEPPFPS